ncbi:MAG: hypothetical protein LBR14_02210 [Clostridiales Family XIII bacterium]|nr:hypothetical protein [Clostridiales Family XIII bacterium]
MDEVCFVRKEGRRTSVVTPDGSYWTYAPFGEVVRSMQPYIFLCHSRLGVNLSRLVLIRKDALVFPGGLTASLGRTARQRTKKAWMQTR